jgi:drug/metabolite transporter (DMT)-like permease
VAIVFGLLAAISYGGSDFAAGLASRRVAPAVITVAVESLTLLTVLIELLVAAPRLPTMHVLAWGAVSGLGTALGTLSLYKGLAVARMSVVATLAAVLNAVIPVIVGLALGNHLGPLAAIGIVIALPAIGLVSWHPDQLNDQATREGVIYGVLAGIGFSLLFIALDQAGTRSGGWPVVPSQIVALVIVLPLAVRGLRTTSAPTRGTMWITLGSGLTSGLANLWFLAAVGRGELATVAVVVSLYPATTVLLARSFLAEHWNRTQALGLLLSLAAVVLVGVS